jgi:hypothetical protein
LAFSNARRRCRNSEVQEHLLVEMYARGLSTRDVKDCFRDESGRSISRTAVSEIIDQLWEDFQEFCSRDLSGFALNRGIHFDDGDRGPVGAWIASPESGGSWPRSAAGGSTSIAIVMTWNSASATGPSLPAQHGRPPGKPPVDSS